MAEATNGVQQMAMMMLNPQFAAQQQKFALQQAMAEEMMKQGSEEPPTNQLANPGGMVVQNSPWAALSRAVEKGVGAYSAQKAIGDQLAATQEMAKNNGIGDVNDPLSPTMKETAYGMGEGGLGKAMYEARTAGIKARNAAQGDTVTDANGNIRPKSDYLSPAINNPAPPIQPPIVSKANPANTDQTPDGKAALSDMYDTKPETNVMPNPIPGTTPGVPAKAPNVPMAADGKPLLPNVTNIPPPDPSGTPKFKTENTKTGVEQTIQDQKDAAEGNKAFATMSQSLGQEKSRLDNLIQVYKDVQSGTLTAQNPEFFNKMAALGFKDDPKSIKDLAGIQNATQNHILQVIQQIKDTNANAGGGAPTRTFGSEITQLLANGESAKGQPEALWNVIGQAKGVVDHHLDMVNGWQKAGGLGNRLAGGYTMRPDDYATQFSTSHNISDYRDKALKDMGPFKGMAGNASGFSANALKTPDDIGNAFKSGKITRQQATQMLQQNHGYQ